MGLFLRPPELVDVAGPVVFLAGPIQGAADWHSEAIALLNALAPDLHIASPCYDKQDADFVYEKQVDWETRYLSLAGRAGAILFWLAKEFHHRCDRAYAQTSRFELGEWKAWHERDGARIVVGIEDGFSNARYIRRRFAQDCPRATIWSTLAETCGRRSQLPRGMSREKETRLSPAHA